MVRMSFLKAASSKQQPEAVLLHSATCKLGLVASCTCTINIIELLLLLVLSSWLLLRNKTCKQHSCQASGLAGLHVPQQAAVCFITTVSTAPIHVRLSC
jgi:hypothetical protein